MHEVLIQQTVTLLENINITCNGLILLLIGLTGSIFFGLSFMAFIGSWLDLMFYIIGIFIPLLPTILNLERYQINGSNYMA